MNSFLRKLKKHKLLVLLAILAILILIFCVKLVIIFTESDEEAYYGNRLNSEDYVELDETKYKTLFQEKFKDQTESISVRTQGRIINVILNLNADVSRDTAKDLANQCIKEFSDTEKSYYDIQIFLNKKNPSTEETQFPIIGYKHHTKDEIKWTKDR